eukprot:TRINITY_DN10452_c0_g1_i2.p2 TRINITY_DN10452_c0_g1~~TRINITY_DN10452_c0_g1_i2.p2  ORF type:complete len:123 (-),score=23.47 TRINITY_DN10452_c0_g1_i2:37-405(-)
MCIRDSSGILLDFIKQLSTSTEADDLPIMSQPSSILNNKQLSILYNSLPGVYRVSDWNLVYSSLVHGTSYNTMIRKCEQAQATLMVIRDMNDYVFGAFCNKPWRRDKAYSCLLYTSPSPRDS